MELHKILIGMLVFVFVISASLAIINGTLEVKDSNDRSIYNITYDDSKFHNISDKLNEIYNVSSDMLGDTTAQEITQAEKWQDMITGAYKAITRWLKSFTIIDDVVGIVVLESGMPPWMMYYITTGLLIGVVFTIIYLLWKINI